MGEGEEMGKNIIFVTLSFHHFRYNIERTWAMDFTSSEPFRGTYYFNFPANGQEIFFGEKEKERKGERKRLPIRHSSGGWPVWVQLADKSEPPELFLQKLW